MGLVKFGRVWKIETRDDYEKALAVLADNEFCAEMSDDFSRWASEKAEVARQRADVIRQAREKGIC